MRIQVNTRNKFFARPVLCRNAPDTRYTAVVYDNDGIEKPQCPSLPRRVANIELSHVVAAGKTLHF